MRINFRGDIAYREAVVAIFIRYKQVLCYGLENIDELSTIKVRSRYSVDIVHFGALRFVVFCAQPYNTSTI